MELECVLNSHLFSGFSTIISLKNVETLDDIIVMVISTLYNILNTYNLTSLVSHLNELSFHIEKVTLDDIMKGRINKVIISEDDYSDSE